MTTPSAQVEATPLAPCIDYDAVLLGVEQAPIPFVVTAAEVEAYRDAVGSEGACGTVPAMHVLAVMMAVITERMPLPATCVHVGQELEWHGAIAPDVPLEVTFGLLTRRRTPAGTLSAFSLALRAEGRDVVSGRILLQS